MRSNPSHDKVCCGVCGQDTVSVWGVCPKHTRNSSQPKRNEVGRKKVHRQYSRRENPMLENMKSLPYHGETLRDDL
jgi:hypothetical protein